MHFGENPQRKIMKQGWSGGWPFPRKFIHFGGNSRSLLRQEISKVTMRHDGSKAGYFFIQPNNQSGSLNTLSLQIKANHKAHPTNSNQKRVNIYY